MEYIEEDYKQYWETNMFFQTEELDSWGWEEGLSGYYDSSSPEGTPFSVAEKKNIISERNRRKKLNERLFALRSVVPNISKMDKASIIKDAIEYIQDLHEQERVIEAEICELELERLNNPISDFNLENSKIKKKRPISNPAESSQSIDIVELNVTYVGEKTLLVSITCDKKTAHTIVKLCEVFEYLKLKIITSSITSLSGNILKTIFVEGDEEEKDQLKIQIENAIAALSDPENRTSF